MNIIKNHPDINTNVFVDAEDEKVLHSIGYRLTKGCVAVIRPDPFQNRIDCDCLGIVTWHESEGAAIQHVIKLVSGIIDHNTTGGHTSCGEGQC